MNLAARIQVNLWADAPCSYFVDVPIDM